MIKILYIVDGLRSGGKERRVLSLLKKLTSIQGYQLELILLNKEVHFKEVFDLKIKTHIVDRSELSYFSIFKKVLKIKRTFSPDVIHAWDTLSTLYAIPISKFNRVKLMTSKITDAPPHHKRLSSYGILSEICFQFSDFILANSRAGLLAYKVSNKKSRVIYNGFDFKRLQNLNPEAPLKRSIGVDKKFIVSMVASFSAKKDFKTFIKAAEEVLKRRDDIAFLCVGDGPQREKLQELHQKDTIIFLGKRDDVESLVNISDIGVLLSTDGEGISNSLLEFMALGKPVIASNNNGNKELILHGKTGLILNSNDDKELADKLMNMLSDEKRSREMGANGEERVKNVFAIDRMVLEFKEVYKNVLDKYN